MELKIKYDDEMPHKLRVANGKDFSFSELENMLISNKIKQVEENIIMIKNLLYRNIWIKAGIVFIDY